MLSQHFSNTNYRSNLCAGVGFYSHTVQQFTCARSEPGAVSPQKTDFALGGRHSSGAVEFDHDQMATDATSGLQRKALRIASTIGPILTATIAL